MPRGQHSTMHRVARRRPWGGLQQGVEVVTGVMSAAEKNAARGGSIFNFGPGGGGARPTATPSRAGVSVQTQSGQAGQSLAPAPPEAPPPGGP